MFWESGLVLGLAPPGVDPINPAGFYGLTGKGQLFDQGHAM